MANSTFAQRVQAAREQGAAHTTQLGLARWTSGNTHIQMELASSLMPTSQVCWHAQAQKDFLAWLQGGGFACEAGTLALVESGNVEENASPNTEATALPAAAPSSHRGDNLRGIVILS